MDRLGNLFANPPDEFWPVPWWAWSGELSPETIDKQLASMHEQGIREFFIFPIYGMVPEYMAEGYFERIERVIKRCRELGMKVWIYDDLNWPSGTAAGLVPRRHPDAVARYLYLEVHSGASAADVEKLLADPAVVHVARLLPDGKAEALSRETLKPGEKLDVAAYRRVRDQNANLTVWGCLWTRRDPGMLDMISESACHAFIEEAYEPIAKRFPGELGKTIKGFFTDEPSMPPGNVPWTDTFASEFKRKFGYDLVPRLHELTYQTGDWEGARIDYWQLVSEKYSNSYIGQLADWCGKHKLMLTGHLVYEENSITVWYQGDSPMSLVKMHVPGCDLLEMHTSYDEIKGWYIYGAASIIKAPKNPATAARFAGRKRVMCEAWGVAPWARTMADEKRMADWLIALGVNMINDNSLISDIWGFRKRAIAGKHFTQPWWPHARKSYEYTARLSALCAETTLDTELLVLYPTTTWWANTVRGDLQQKLRELEQAFDAAQDALLRTHWDFEFLYEPVLEGARVENGALVTDHGTFRGIILAGISHLRPRLAAKLAEFAASGGAVFVVQSDAVVVDRNARRPLELKVAIPISDWRSPEFAGSLDAALSKRVHRPWRVTGPEAGGTISAARVDLDGRRFLFVANMTPREKDLRIEWDGESAVEFWDADGARRWSPPQSKGECRLMLPEGESVYVIERRGGSGANPEPPAQYLHIDPGRAVEINGPWKLSLDRPNIFRLECRLKPDPKGDLKVGSSDLQPDDSWPKLNLGEGPVPLMPETMKFYWLACEFEVETAIPDLRLVVDSDEVEEAYLDGKPLGKSSPVTVWDDANRAFEISERASKGRHVLLVKVRPSPYSAKDVAVPGFPTTFAEPVVLRGSFAAFEAALRQAQDGIGDRAILRSLPQTIDSGDARPQGFPHFAGTLTYTKTFDWPGPEGPVLIDCEVGRDLVEVLIDNTSLGARAWGPRRFLAERMTKGEHVLRVRITGTLGNLLRRTYGGLLCDAPAFGLLSPVKLGPVI